MQESGNANSMRVEEIVHEPLAPQLLGRSIDRGEIAADTGAFELLGWVIPRLSSVRRVTVVADGRTVGETNLNYVRPDLAAAFPDVPDAEAFGFRATLQLHPPESGEIHVQAELDDGQIAPLGTIRLEPTRADTPTTEESGLPADEEERASNAESATRTKGRLWPRRRRLTS